MKKINISIAVIIIILAGIGFWKWEKVKKENSAPLAAPAVQVPAQTENSNNHPSSQSGNITCLISKEDRTKFCNGSLMDSEGYRKTITTEVVSDIPQASLTENEVLKQIAILATDGMCQTALKQTDFQVTDGTVEISPISGWAGVSIAMCACKPQVEVNLLRLPGIEQVVWLSN